MQILETLKQKLKEMQGNPTDPKDAVRQQMRQVEEILKIEANQKSTLKTMERLIKMSKKNHACFLCKHAVNEATLQTMEGNFNVQGERMGIDGK